MPGTAARIALGLVLSLVIAGLAYRRQSLSKSGILGAALLGSIVFGLGGWVWGGLLVAFFVSSSLLSHYRAPQKALLAERAAKGGRRDLQQVLANGGVAGLLALLVGLWGKDHALYPALAFGFYGALAAVNADTWATELGMLAPGHPRLITTGARVPAGTSGGVTRLGLTGALAGAGFIGLAAFVLIQGAALVTLGGWLWQDWVVVPVALLSGFAGSLVDSLLGATYQARYRCPACAVETERVVHACGRPTDLVGGWKWLDNDAVNFLASLAGGLVGALLSIPLLA